MIFTKQKQHLLVGVYFVFLAGFLQPVTSRVCTTKNCHTLARQLRENIRKTVHPCDDFYEYACGGWVKKHPELPDGVKRFSRTAENLKRLQNQLAGLLQEEISPNDLKAVQAAKKQFQNCINDDKLRAQGLGPLIQIIKENGGWPMIENSTFMLSKSWQEVHDNYLVKTGIGSIMDVLLQVKPDGATIIVDHGSPLFELPFDPLDKLQIQKRIDFIIEVARKFAAENNAYVDHDVLKQDATYIHKIDQALNNLRNTDTWRHIGPLMTINAANTFLVSGTRIDFDLYTGLRRIFSNVPGERSLSQYYEVIRVREKAYLRGVMEVLSNFSDRDILNYINFHFAERQIYRTTPEMRDLYSKYFNVKQSNRTLYCMQAENLKRVLSYMYLKRYFSPADQVAAETVVNGIKASIEKQIKQSGWIDAQSLPVAIEKIKNLDQSVGYRSYFLNETDIEDAYSEYNMGDSFVINMLNYKEAVYKQYLSQFGSAKNRQAARLKPQVYPIDLSSLYHIRHNRLDIPATNLQLPFFSVSLPFLANYAGAGAIAANQLATMYNDVGRHFDGKGNVMEWLSTRSSWKYDERYQCYGKQLVNYTLDALRKAGITHDTIHPSALPQTFMDSFALRTAYDAFMDRVHSNGQPSVQLPDLDEYSAEKQFFLAYANPFCEATTGTSLVDFIEPGANTPSAMRVNIAVANSPEFSEAFNCLEDSPMNPRTKCRFFI